MKFEKPGFHSSNLLTILMITVQVFRLKEPYLGSSLFSDKVSYKNKSLCTISFSNDIRFQIFAKLNFDGVCAPLVVDREWRIIDTDAIKIK